jgi:hypothetical protein
MQPKLIFMIMSVLFLAGTVSAQTNNIDSLSLISKISADQLKLAKLEGMVAETTKNLTEANSKAQQSANYNIETANNLSADPENKTLARKADNSASDAKSEARKARKAADKLSDLNKEIMDQKNKLVLEQQKLNGYTQTPVVYPAVVPIPAAPPVQPDTAGHQ